MNNFKIDGVSFYKRPAKKEIYDYIKVFESLAFIYFIPDIWDQKSYFYNSYSYFNIYRIDSILKSTNCNRPVITADPKNRMAISGFRIDYESKVPLYFLREDIKIISSNLNKIKEKYKIYELFK